MSGSDEHTCHHETDIALMKDALLRVETNTQEICRVLKGNGMGLVTEIALLKQSDKRKWWWLGAISMGLVGLALSKIF